MFIWNLKFERMLFNRTADEFWTKYYKLRWCAEIPVLIIKQIGKFLGCVSTAYNNSKLCFYSRREIIVFSPRQECLFLLSNQKHAFELFFPASTNSGNYHIKFLQSAWFKPFFNELFELLFSVPLQVLNPVSGCLRLVFLVANRITWSPWPPHLVTSSMVTTRRKNFTKQNHFQYWEDAELCMLLKVIKGSLKELIY